MWEKVKLGDVCTIFGGYAFKSDQYVKNAIPLVRISNITENQIILDDECSIEENSKFNQFEILNGDILVALSGATTGKFGVFNSNNKAYVNQRVALIRRTDKTCQRFVLYYLNQIKEDILRKAGGAAQPNISTSELGKFEIPLPPLTIQEKIAEILDKADELRRKDKDLQTKYDELAQAIFIDMFGDPVRNEKGWEVKRLHDLGTVDRGVSKHRPRNAPELLNGLYPLIQTGDVANSGGWISKYKATYSEIGLKQSKMWSSGTLCITIAANIAKTGILTFDACFPDSIVGFISNSSSNEVFIQYWFSFFQKILEDQAPESAQKNINLAILRSLEIIVPPIHLQEAFAKKIELINQLKAQTNAEKSEELFQSLLQKAFRGELVS